uniref:Alternative protein LOC644366 n=1 Tax=Homo sapiens TaxID=9606 RepID=L8EBJ3_HUMAN|nr:alternative protein LOC644366 [Homo sapiens]
MPHLLEHPWPSLAMRSVTTSHQNAPKSPTFDQTTFQIFISDFLKFWRKKKIK